MEFVPCVFRRMTDRGMEIPVESEWSATKDLLSKDKEAYVSRHRLN